MTRVSGGVTFLHHKLTIDLPSKHFNVPTQGIPGIQDVAGVCALGQHQLAELVGVGAKVTYRRLVRLQGLETYFVHGQQGISLAQHLHPVHLVQRLLNQEIGDGIKVPKARVESVKREMLVKNTGHMP